MAAEVGGVSGVPLPAVAPDAPADPESPAPALAAFPPASAPEPALAAPVPAVVVLAVPAALEAPAAELVPLVLTTPAPAALVAFEIDCVPAAVAVVPAAGGCSAGADMPAADQGCAGAASGFCEQPTTRNPQTQQMHHRCRFKLVISNALLS